MCKHSINNRQKHKVIVTQRTEIIKSFLSKYYYFLRHNLNFVLKFYKYIDKSNICK